MTTSGAIASATASIPTRQPHDRKPRDGRRVQPRPNDRPRDTPTSPGRRRTATTRRWPGGPGATASGMTTVRHRRPVGEKELALIAESLPAEVELAADLPSRPQREVRNEDR